MIAKLSLKIPTMLKFTTCVPKSSFEDLNEQFAGILLSLADFAESEDACAYPFDIKVTSAYRSPLYEQMKGRNGKSSHCKRIAVDVHVSNSFQRWFIIRQALILGIPRIGIYKTFLHLDMDFDKDAPIIFIGEPFEGYK